MSSERSSQTHQSSRTSPDPNTISRHLIRGQAAHLKKLLHGSTRELRRSLFRTTRELRDCLHEAIGQKNFALLKVLVDYCEAHVEAKNEKGLTPLYHAVHRHWVHGALFLLRRGADVHNAESSLRHASCRYRPLIHAVVKTGSTRLLKEVVRRGADINALCMGGHNCLVGRRPSLPKDMVLYIDKEMKRANPQLEEGSLEEVQMLQTGMPTAFTRNERELLEGLLANQHSQDPRERMQLLGAWNVTKGDYVSALRCWKDLWQSNGSDVDGSRDFESFWAGILGVSNPRLLELGNVLWYNQTNCDTFALLIIAKYAPADKLPVFQISRVLRQLIDNEEFTLCMHAMGYLSAFSVPRQSHLGEFPGLQAEVLQRLVGEKAVPFSLLLDSVTIATRCLFALARDRSFSTDGGLTTRHDLSTGNDNCILCTRAVLILLNMLATMGMLHHQTVWPGEEKLQRFLRPIKYFVSMFPRIRSESFFHYIRDHLSTSLFTRPSIKTLVILSAAALGTNRHENSPPHLVPDRNGHTPLHVYADCMSSWDLREGGVVQCFLDHGAHLCTRSNRGVTARDVLVANGSFTEGELLPSLQCLAAAAFMRNEKLRETVHDLRPERIRHFLLDH